MKNKSAIKKLDAKEKKHPTTGDARHKWNIFTDTCDKCSIKKRKRPVFNALGTIRICTIDEYFVNGKWIDKMPECNSSMVKSKNLRNESN
jgi:hypothetical protein